MNACDDPSNECNECDDEQDQMNVMNVMMNKIFPLLHHPSP